MDIKSPRISIIPPQPRMRIFYECEKCGKTFLASIPVFNFFGLKLKCPDCGSSKVTQDYRVRY